jgi:acid phosphatase
MRIHFRRLLRIAALPALACLLPPALAAGVPSTPPSHIVVVVMENHATSQILGSAQAPYISGLAKSGATFTQSFAVAHPSQPNYLALFSGSTHGVKDDRCPLTFNSTNLAQQLLDAGKTFVGYSEGLPSVGYAGCTAAGGYARKHAPWVNFRKLPSTVNQPFSAFPAADFEQLPTVAFVVPSLGNDMHDGTVAEGDSWLKTRLDLYVHWAQTHNSLLIVTWDEDDGHHGNQVLTIFHGPMVRAGSYGEHITHYEVLRTIEDLLGLAHVGIAAKAKPIEDIWSP